MALKKLPIGIQAFEVLRTQGYVYVDKTPDIHRMVTQGMYYFLSRPRRFGKSLLVSTLKCLFQAKRELFEGLWIAEHGAWDWQAHPVIALDFTVIPARTTTHLEQNLAYELTRIAKTHDLSLTAPSIEKQFEELILALRQQTGMPVIVLIDEYDKPLIDHLGRGPDGLQIAKANRDLLKSFFGVLKGGTIAPALGFVFLTGISRFSRVSLFSELNNLNDLSMHRDYAAMLGYTQEELEAYFPEHLERLAAASSETYADTLARLARQYNGYRFSERDVRVYNPFSILKAFSEQSLKNFWFETGTPTFLINLLQQEHYDVSKIENLAVSQTVFSTFDVERLRPEALLFQTGYVTIRDVGPTGYTLGYPNQEVKVAFSESLLLAIADWRDQEISSHVVQLGAYLRSEQFDAFFETMAAIFASIPYDIETRRDEAYFHTLFYLLVTASGAGTRSSVLTCQGRIDMLVEFPDKIYVFEFKCNQRADTALQQIHDKQYAAPYRHSGQKIILIGVNFSTEERNIVEWQVG